MAEVLNRLDGYIGESMDELEKLDLDENSLLVVMADNGPMVHNPPSLFGMADTIFHGGKGDVTEGGVRVPAFDPLDFIKFNMPDELRVTSRVNAVD